MRGLILENQTYSIEAKQTIDLKLFNQSLNKTFDLEKETIASLMILNEKSDKCFNTEYIIKKKNSRFFCKQFLYYL